MRLFIAEKPSLGEAIAGCLSGEYKKHRGSKGPTHITVGKDTVTWCYGHIYELLEPEEYEDTWKKWSLESLPIIPKEWRLKPKKEAREQIKIIKSLIGSCSLIVHAGDPDREGQLLVDEVLEQIKNKKPVKRIWLSATDEKSVRRALADLKDNCDFRNLKDSAEARGWGDWLVGMNATRKMTLLGQRAGLEGVLSVGRVQTPTLAMVVARDLMIENFRAKDFYTVSAQILGKGQIFSARWAPSSSIPLDEEGRVLDRTLAEALVSKISDQTSIVTKFESKNRSEPPPLPYSLDKLQMDANKIFGFSAKETLDITQELYEAKLVSYPRSDCGYLPESQFADAAEILDKLTALYPKWIEKSDRSLRSSCWNDTKVTAHHGIIPTGLIGTIGLKKASIYELIVKRFASQFYHPYRFEETEVELSVKDETLKAKGRIPIDLGWKQLYGNEQDQDAGTEKENSALPHLEIGEKTSCLTATVEAKKTTPPQRYSEASLLSSMLNIHQQENDPEIKKRLKESAGIGTPATRAGIIETLKKRGFIAEKKKILISTEKGRSLIQALPLYIKSPGLTALFEQLLETIAAGKYSKEEFLKKQTEFITKFVNADISGNFKPAQNQIRAR